MEKKDEMSTIHDTHQKEISTHRNSIDDWLMILMVSVFLSLTAVFFYLYLSGHLSFKSY